jgi:hypothetical protein
VSEQNNILSINDRLDIYELRRRLAAPGVNEVPIDLDLYTGPHRENNDQLVFEIKQKYKQFRHERLDAHGIPRERTQCTSYEIAHIDRRDKKLRNASLSGSYMGMLRKLTVTQRGELAARFYGLYTVFTSQPNRSDEVAYRFWEGDVTAAMDNLLVPRYLDECTTEEQTHLAIKMAEREQDAADLARRAMEADVDPAFMERIREITRKHPVTFVPLTPPKIGPRGHTYDVDPYPLDSSVSDFMGDAMLSQKHLGPDIGDAQALRDLDYLELMKRYAPVGRRDDLGDFVVTFPKDYGQSFAAFARGKTRSILEGGIKRNELWVVPSFNPPRSSCKTMFTEYAIMDWENRSRCYPAINFSDSIDMFHAKMLNRPRSGRTPGYYAVHLAYEGLPDITGEIRIPRSPQMGFFLHAAYPLLEREMPKWGNYPTYYSAHLAELAWQDLFPHIPQLDYDNPNRTCSAPRYPNRRK